MRNNNHGASLHTRAPLVIRVKVIPHGSKSEMRGFMADGTWKIAIAAAPEKGKANAALIRFLAEHFRVPRAYVTIMSGLTNQRKIIKILNS